MCLIRPSASHIYTSSHAVIIRLIFKLGGHIYFPIILNSYYLLKAKTKENNLLQDYKVLPLVGFCLKTRLICELILFHHLVSYIISYLNSCRSFLSALQYGETSYQLQYRKESRRCPDLVSLAMAVEYASDKMPIPKDKVFKIWLNKAFSRVRKSES